MLQFIPLDWLDHAASLASRGSVLVCHSYPIWVERDTLPFAVARHSARFTKAA